MVINVNLQKYAGTSDPVTLYLIDPDGALVAEAGDALSEIDNGLFQAAVAEDLEAEHYVAEIYVGDLLIYQGWLVPEVSGLVDDPLIGSGAADVQLIVNSLLSALTATDSEIQVTSPQIDARGRLSPLIRACDYAAADGNAITTTVSTTANLAGATIEFNASAGEFHISGSGTATQDNQVPTKWHLSIELTAEETDKPADEYGFAITALLTGGRRVPLRAGILPLREDFQPRDDAP